MERVSGLLRAAAARLAAVSDSPRLDAELLLAHAAGISRTQLLARSSEPLEAPQFESLLARRLNHEPIPYITGECEFFSLAFWCRAPVLVPRPETEHLVEAALRHLAGRETPSVLDLCTGTGCVAISIACNARCVRVDAVDRQRHAVDLARENAARLKADVRVWEGDLFAALPDASARYDVIVSNPPYVSVREFQDLSPIIRKHEDPVALVAGESGMDLIERILAGAAPWLKPGGLLALEMGETQAPLATEAAERHGWRVEGILHDLAGHPRVLTATLR